MNAWQLIFLQSKVNDNPYNGDSLAAQMWAWPQGTWFQKRLHDLRKKRRPTPMDSIEPWNTDTLRPAAGLDKAGLAPARLLAGNSVRSKEFSYGPHAGADAYGGINDFSRSATGFA